MNETGRYGVGQFTEMTSTCQRQSVFDCGQFGRYNTAARHSKRGCVCCLRLIREE